MGILYAYNELYMNIPLEGDEQFIIGHHPYCDDTIRKDNFMSTPN